MRTLKQGGIVHYSFEGRNCKLLSFSNVFHHNKYIFLLFFIWCSVSGQVQITIAQRVNFQIPPHLAGKLINSEDIMKGFEEGEARVKVIVNLVKPVEVLAATDWDSRTSLNALQAEILARQKEVLPTLYDEEFSLRNRFENQAAFSGEITLKGLNKLLNNPRVESIEPVYIEEINLAQGIQLINGMAYRSIYNGTGVAIAITDTGIDYTHPKLGGGGFPNSKVIGGYDFGDDDPDPMPNGQGHGTCCAGIAAGDLGNTGDYMGGVAYNAKLYALKVTYGTGPYTHNDDVIDAWNWCISHKNDDPANPILVISHSMGINRYYSTCDSFDGLQSAYATAANNAAAAGITMLSSSGNDGYCDSIRSPSCLSNVISVGAVYDAAVGTFSFCVDDGSCAIPGGSLSCDPGEYSTKQVTSADLVTVYSNTASFLDVLAPAHNAYTTDIAGSEGYSTGDYYSSFGGTSAACPYAAGAVACLQSAVKEINGIYFYPSEIRDILTLTGDNITDEKVAITKPRINLRKALESFLPCCPTTISSYPYAEGFEDGFGYWVNADGDDIDWTRQTGSTPTSGTGPSSAHEGNYYLYVESSSPNYPDKTTVLDGPCFDLSSLSWPQLRFWYHMYGVAMGVLTVKVSDDNCASWNTVWTLSGNQDNAWHEALVDLSAYSGSTIKIQFIGSTGSSYTSDMAIDDVRLKDYVPRPPVAENVDVPTLLNTPVTITLEAYDDGYPPPGILKYIITSLPVNGTLSEPSAGSISSVPYKLVNNGNQVVYTPDSEYTGSDSFQFKASDGGIPPNGGDSNVATVSMDVGYPITAEYQVGSSYDDVYADGSTSQNSTYPYLRIGYTSLYGVPYYMSGMRFTNVNIPKGATIYSAYLKVQSYIYALSNEVYGNIQAEAADDAANFNGRYIAGLAKTGASVNWDHTTSWSSSTWYTSPNIAGVVQEVINRSGWLPNNSLAIFYSTRKASGGDRVFSSYDGGSSYAPKLEITYISSTPPTTYTISGRVTYQGSGLAGVSMDGLGVFTDADGYYKGVVPNGWSGTVTPSKSGYNFNPPSISYSNVTSDQVNQDYTADKIKYTISGYVRTSGGSGISGVTMTGWPGTVPVTNSSGYYSGKVTYGWSGTIIPDRTGYGFSPSSKSYSNVISDKLSENYTGIPITYTISGYVKTSAGTGISGVTMTGWPDTAPVTDGTGYYSGTVSYDWSGTITPNKSGYTFEPSSRSYSNVISDQSNQDYMGEIPMVIVPNVVGLSEAEAETALDAFGLLKGVLSYAYSDTVPEGSVISQTPVAGTSVAAGSAVDLVISHTPVVIYVDIDATQGANNGSSWVNAFTSLQDALTASLTGDEIRVAQGLYRPAGAYGSRTATFQLKSGVAIKGGYAGFGQLDPDARDVNLYKSILSGDLNGNDGPNFANNAENSYHVLVTGSGTDETAVLDGFTITAGNANGTSDPNDEHGGGLLNEINSSPTIIDCTFFANSAFKYGGGMASDVNSSPTVTNCTFSSNSAEFSGGMHSDANSSSIVINCTFTDNRARSDGGGFYNYVGNPYLVNCTFTNNRAERYGGGILNFKGDLSMVNCVISRNSAVAYGGGMFNWDDSNSTLTNCLFSGNTVKNFYGGGIFDWHNSGSLTMTNCTFSGNSAVGGNTLARDSYQQQKSGNIEFANCILWDGVDEIRNYDSSTITITYSDVQGGWPGLGNIDTDPFFVDPGAHNNHLSSDSPCIDAGDNAVVPPDANDLDGDGNITEPIPWDIDRNPRIIGDKVDMGAYEFQGINLITGDFCGANFGPPDGYVDVWDLMQFADQWHTDTGDSNWDSKFDLAGSSFGDPDGYIDVWDLMVFADHWHEGQKP